MASTERVPASFDRIGIVAHPTRDVEAPLSTLRAWAAGRGVAVAQVPTDGGRPDLAPPATAAECDLVVALGGDGTTLVALHAAAPAGRAVLGVACGSLGALTATSPTRFAAALERIAAGDWTPRSLPAVVAERDGRAPLVALNDLVLVRAGAGQVVVEVVVDGERYIRFSGDGLIAATPLGSSAYTLAAGGPMLVAGSRGLVLTPLAPHGGVVPPLVTTETTSSRSCWTPATAARDSRPTGSSPAGLHRTSRRR